MRCMLEEVELVEFVGASKSGSESLGGGGTEVCRLLWLSEMEEPDEVAAGAAESTTSVASADKVLLGRSDVSLADGSSALVVDSAVAVATRLSSESKV